MSKQGSTYFLVALLVLTTLVIAGCGAPAATTPAPAAVADESAAAELPVTIDVTMANDLRGRDDVILLDVREDYEFNNGHVPGAAWIPLGELPNRLDELPKDKTIVAVCRSGNRSGQATELLRQQGFDAHNMQGGMLAWQAAGLEVEK
jgi:rhodanese-related sulfurtransferase